jgi:hypothetical protein
MRSVIDRNVVMQRIPILLSHFHLVISRSLCRSGSPTKILYAFLFSSVFTIFHSLPAADPVFVTVSLCSLCGTLRVFLTSVLGFGVREYRITKFNLV